MVVKSACFITALCIAAFNAPAAWAGGLTWTTVNDPNSTGYGQDNTQLTGISDNDTMSGYFSDFSNLNQYQSPTQTGLVVSGGTDYTYLVPGAAYTQFNGISSNAGYLVGSYNGNTQGAFVLSGFSLSNGQVTGGTMSPIAVPGATYTAAQAVNSSGEVVGWYEDAQYNVHGFVYTPGANPTYQTTDAPGALATYLDGVNDNGTIVGEDVTTDAQVPTLTDQNAIVDDSGSFFDLTGVANSYAYANGINNAGRVVGCTYNGNGSGFTVNYLGAGNFGGIVALNDPAAGQVGFTCATGVNNTNAIDGYYGQNSDPDGFLLTGNFATPTPEPASLALLGGGLFGLLAARRRRRG